MSKSEDSDIIVDSVIYCIYDLLQNTITEKQILPYGIYNQLITLKSRCSVSKLSRYSTISQNSGKRKHGTAIWLFVKTSCTSVLEN